MENLKRCIKCGEEKELSEFHKHSKTKDGLQNECKICTCKRSVEWVKDNPEKYREKQKEWRENNVEKIKEYNRIYRQDNSEKSKEYSKKWRENNLEKTREDKKIYNRFKRKNSIHFKLKDNISCLIKMRLKRRLLSKNGKSTFSFLPYTIDDLIKHLESLFQPWMNWQNYSNKPGCWVIDHKYPDSLFNYKSVEDEEFQKCWTLENLQPMEFIENAKKGNRY